jgi:hypothetical protein
VWPETTGSAVGFSNCGLVLCLRGGGGSAAFGFRIACSVLANRKTLCFSASPYQAIRMIELFGIRLLYAATEQLVAGWRGAEDRRACSQPAHDGGFRRTDLTPTRASITE